MTQRPTGSSISLCALPGEYEWIEMKVKIEIHIPGISFLLRFLLLMMLVSSSVAAGSDEKLVRKVDELLLRFPSHSMEVRDKNAAELLELGGKGIQEVCSRLQPADGEDDSRVRFALNGITVYVRGPGKNKERLLYAGSVIKSLNSLRDKEVKAFLIRQLQLAGQQESIAPVAKYLHDRDLCEPATQALLAIGGPKAEKAFVEAIEKGPAANRITLVKAVGEVRSRDAVPLLLEYARSGNSELRQVALQALANIGDPAAEDLLAHIRLTSPPFERTRAPSLYLLYAQRLAESGDKKAAARICHEILYFYTAPQEQHIPCQALSILVQSLGESALGDLLRAVHSPHKALRVRALDLAEEFPGEGATRLWLEELQEVGPEAQAEIIAMLGRRGDRLALPVVLGYLHSPDVGIRIAAIPAAFQIGGAQVLRDLLPLLDTEDREQIQTLQAVFLEMSADSVIIELGERLDKVGHPVQAALLEVLASRRAAPYVDKVFALLESENSSVRKAAFANLSAFVGPADLYRLLELLETAARSEVRHIQDAIVASANQIPEPEARAGLILSAISASRGVLKADLLRPLARIGGAGALQVVLSETRSEDVRVRTAAVYTLSQWPHISAAPELLKLAQTSREQKFASLALQGYLRLEGFIPLFNGRNLEGWTGDTTGYMAEDGKIVVYPDRGGGNLYTENEYSDFVLIFEFQLTPGANNGLGIRAPLEGDAAYAGMEIQILDNSAPQYQELHVYQYHGSIYGVVPARRGFQRPVGEWNFQEVIANGRRITVRLNGETIVDADIDQASLPQTLDGQDHPGLKRERGHIGFLGHGSRVAFRNIYIKEIR